MKSQIQAGSERYDVISRPRWRRIVFAKAV
jgi:hypothetical protein